MLSFRAYSILFFAGTHLEVIIKFVYRLLFFFSSRRRYTRWPRDWSSDVCSSDLFRKDFAARITSDRAAKIPKREEPLPDIIAELAPSFINLCLRALNGGCFRKIASSKSFAPTKIGRASCRERVYRQAAVRA